MLQPERSSAEWWDARYRNGDIPWDTGIVPPEVVALVASDALTPGWALDLGCGSGLSSRYLARHGFRVVGVDLAHSALVRGAVAAQAEELAAYSCRGDVADLAFLHVAATFALDIGCCHALAPDRRPAYVASLAAHQLPGAFYLLYAFAPIPGLGEGELVGLSPADVARFAPQFCLRWAQHGRDRTRPSAWYLFQRTGIF